MTVLIYKIINDDQNKQFSVESFSSLLFLITWSVVAKVDTMAQAIKVGLTLKVIR